MFSRLRLTVIAIVLLSAFPASALAQERALRSMSDLLVDASRQVAAVSVLPLVPATSNAFKNLASFETGNGQVPNYLRALALIPPAASPYSTAIRTLIFGGSVEPETKMAMALEIARHLQSPYAIVHAKRWLTGSDRGRALLTHFESNAAIGPEQSVAIDYAGWLTDDVHGVSDGRFRQVRGYYNDAQIVELTLAVSFFNYFTRLVEAVNLPVEAWALQPAAVAPPIQRERPSARVALISDQQIEWAANAAAARRRTAQPGDGPGLGLVNSQRAMNLVPDIATAWRAYTGSIGPDSVLSREIKLQVSFAVSTANGCRYCTLHQVLGLRRLGVSIDKLVQMQKDDSALTPRELTAVAFARKLTRAPAAVTEADYQKLRAEFGERGALEVVLQTCNFAFMNRFTDNLGLPSEDEAVAVYRETYGTDWKKK